MYDLASYVGFAFHHIVLRQMDLEVEDCEKSSKY